MPTLPRAVLALTVGLVLAGCSAPPAEPVPGTELLGPEPGERVVDYLARAAGTLPTGGQAWALVQLAEPVGAEAAAALVGDVRVSRVVFRVRLPRVQTALVTVPVPGQRPAEELTGAQRQAAADRERAAERAAAAGQRRAAEVAAVEAAELRAGCVCVLALLVHADRAALRALAARPPVRAIHAATPGLPLPSVAVSPLLPEQTEVAGPVPDDGPVPSPRASPAASR